MKWSDLFYLVIVDNKIKKISWKSDDTFSESPLRPQSRPVTWINVLSYGDTTVSVKTQGRLLLGLDFRIDRSNDRSPPSFFLVVFAGCPFLHHWIVGEWWRHFVPLWCLHNFLFNPHFNTVIDSRRPRMETEWIYALVYSARFYPCKVQPLLNDNISITPFAISATLH